ncbi:MAG: AMP-binding protein [Oscillospiraceae bacterium]|jgi:acetyl-CoA synthetase|nr:AMP-binding protein [Oscillospiraceae bacterium]
MLLPRFLPRQDFSSYNDFLANYRINVPENFNFGFDVVDAWAEIEPEKKALVWCDDNGDERTFTFRDMALLSDQAAGWFSAKGLVKGDKVLLILRRRWEYWVAAIALHKLGVTVVPGSTQLTAKDIEYRVEAAGIKLVLDVAGLKSFDFWNYLAIKPKRQTRNDDLMLMYFTSGTTGMPKMVMHDFTHPLGHIVTAKYWQKVLVNGLHMSVADSGWAKFGWGKFYGQWICGAPVFAYDMNKFSASALLQKMQDYRLATFCAPPTMYRYMLLEDLESYNLSSITHCCNAGEPLNPEVYRQFYERTGLRLTEGFGQSESSVLIANFQWFPPRPGSMGKPSPLYGISLLAEDGRECAPGEEGEIVIRGLGARSGLFTGYYNDEEYTAAAFRDGMYHTGDVAWRDDDGYYWFVGRNDDVIKCSGYRIGPFEVESALMEHPAVVECAVTGAPDPVRGQVVKASVVIRGGYTADGELVKELQEHVKSVTAPYKYPRVIEFVPELPKTSSGKIMRGKIRAGSSAPDA